MFYETVANLNMKKNWNYTWQNETVKFFLNSVLFTIVQNEMVKFFLNSVLFTIVNTFCLDDELSSTLSWLGFVNILVFW